MERTLIILKPDAIQRSLIGEIISRFERKGLKIRGLKMMQLEDAVLEEHYAHIKDRPFFGGIKEYMKATPVVVLAITGINAISAIRLIVGPTKAWEADAGTIRGDFSLSTQSNIVHPLPFPNNSFDGVFCAGLLHLFPKQILQNILSEINRVLKIQGSLVINLAADIERKGIDGNLVTISIDGDPDGLRYLANVLNWLADFGHKHF